MGGSYYIETLTSEIKRKILEEIEAIERVGDYVSFIETGELHHKISSYFLRAKKELEKGDIKIVAHNRYRFADSDPNINFFRYPQGVEERQQEKLAKLRITEIMKRSDPF